MEAGWLGELEGFEDVLLAGGSHRALGDAAVAGLESDQVHAVKLVADVAPGAAGLMLDGADEQERQPAQLDVGADAVFAVVEDRPQPQRAFDVPPAALYLVELLVGGGEWAASRFPDTRIGAIYAAAC